MRTFQQKEAGPNTWTAAFKNRRCCGLEGYTCFCYKGSPGEGGVEYTLRVEISTSVLEL